MELELTKENIFESLCKASRIGNLGLFVGSGFTKHIMEDQKNYATYSWKELLVRVAQDLGVNYTQIDNGLTYPDFATKICLQYSHNMNIPYKDAERKMKQIISSLVNVVPSSKCKDQYCNIFNTLNPNWIITTNYDNVLESIVGEKALVINPKDSYINIKGFISIYHIHGNRKDPDSIVVTNEDYAHTLRVSDYRHARLPFLIKESTVLMIGYGLNDINVLSAVDYSRNVFSNGIRICETPIIQLVHKTNPHKYPYIDRNEIIIMEISSITDFFNEYIDYNSQFRGVIGKKLKKIHGIVEEFTLNDNDQVAKYISDEYFRINKIKEINEIDSEFWNIVYPSYITFLNKVFSELWDKTLPHGAFDEYNDILTMIIDIVENIKFEKTPETLIEFIITEFFHVARYIGMNYGQSFKAYETWVKKKKSLPAQFFKEVEKYFDSSSGARYAMGLINN